jgi:hypothetical protein
MKWEYWFTQYGPDQTPRIEKALTEAGNKGWELVSVVATSGVVMLFFKRPKAP